MRALFVAHSFPRRVGDAAGSFVLRLAVALQRDGVEVRVLAPASPELAALDVVEGVTVERYRYAPRAWETLAYTGTMAEDARSPRGLAALTGMVVAGARATARARRAWRPDVVHAHWWFPGALSATLPGALGALPLVVTMHGSDVRLARGVGAARGLFARVVARASAITAVSSWLCEQATGMAAGLACGVEPMPVATSTFTPPPPDAPRDGLLFVGRLNAQKGLRHLLDALARVPVVPLTVVGDGTDAPALRARAVELRLADRVRWLPTMPQGALVDHYRRARALVVPSVEEGLGLVAVEAALCGTPTVAFDSGGLRDVVANGVTGWLVPPGDVRALASALQTAIESDVRGMGATARDRALQRFSPETVAARYRAIYERAVAAGGDAVGRGS